ncbi:hypothetical protein HD554DRAFT_2171670 [Boletus coccyginus]|nr:hypothetical protein HD554DRAFT_2171670 [Boletus coccyginus]
MPDRASDVPEPDVWEDEHEDTPGALTVDEGHGPHFPCFAQEFLEKPVADIFGHGETPFEQMKHYQEATGRGAYAPFADHDEWALAQWLVKNMNQCATEEFLKLFITKNWMQPSYSSNYTFLRLMDKLPTGSEWTCRLIHIHGNLGPLDENNVAMEGI